ncbi:hypothetical protein EVB39_048 [Rhizobium phage RHph_TM3_3_9]|nr:hypothetical protein EVB39_048 [Rhizobium phage RHph_TM3_3_9]QIG68569.1 hypothetical protein EVB66_048 [Rhizobium phage RHph_TM3_3_13]QIG74427.1 hypothetical protein EVC09_047 [Rhizobium phage RHph_TM3_3_10]QXV74541.1 hypothetical protein [Rhizobium phage RHEph19]
MRNSVWSLPFDASTDFVARRPLAVGDTSLAPGDAVPESAVSPRRLRQLYEMRHVVHRVTYDALVNGIERFESDPFAAPEVAEETPVPVVQPEQPVAEQTFAPLGEDGQPIVQPEQPEQPEQPAASLPGLPGAETPAPVVEPVREPDIEALRAEAKRLNIDFDGRWGVKRLQAEIEKANANGEPA